MVGCGGSHAVVEWVGVWSDGCPLVVELGKEIIVPRGWLLSTSAGGGFLEGLVRPVRFSGKSRIDGIWLKLSDIAMDFCVRSPRV